MNTTTGTLNFRQLNRATLARQLLLARHELSAAEAVARLCGLQAQEAKPPFLGLFSRLAGFRAADLHTALHDRSLVRATMMRGTLHVVTAEDYTAFRTALQPMLSEGLRVLGSRAKGLDLAAVLPVARDLVARRPLNFNQLRPLLTEAFPEVNERALGYAVRMHLPLVMVPGGDRWAFPSVADFTLAEEWLGRPLAAEDAPHELVLRYLAAFGPASATDAQTWSGLKGLKAVLEDLRPKLWTARDGQGRELFDLPDAPRPEADVPAPARFLPEFDNLVLAHSDRTRVLAEEYRGLVVTKNLRVRATFLWDGFVRGTWEAQRRRDTVTLRLTPFEALPKRAVAELTEEGVTVLRFLEPDAGTLDVQVDPAPAG